MGATASITCVRELASTEIRGAFWESSGRCWLGGDNGKDCCSSESNVHKSNKRQFESAWRPSVDGYGE